MLRVGVLVSGGGTNLQALIDSVNSGQLSQVSIALVCSNRKNAFALERATQQQIPAVCLRPMDFENKDAFTQALIDLFVSYQIDLVVMAGYLVVIDNAFVKAFSNRIINIHPSLIPSFCGEHFYGLKVHESALERGVKYTGATVHFVDEGTDTGPIILQQPVEVLEEDTAEILQQRVMEQAEWILLPKAVQLISEDRVKVINNKVIINPKIIQ